MSEEKMTKREAEALELAYEKAGTLTSPNDFVRGFRAGLASRPKVEETAIKDIIQEYASGKIDIEEMYNAIVATLK